MNKQAIIEAVKEVARIMLFAALTALVGWIGTKITEFDPTSLYYVIGTVVLRALDKFVHKSEIAANGIAPF